MKRTRLIALLLCLVLVFAALVACTPSKDPGTKDPENPGTDDPKDEHIMNAYEGEDFYFMGGVFFPKTKRDYTEEELEELEGPIEFSVFEQAKADRAVDLEKQYGIRLIAANGSDLQAADLAASLAAGETKLDAFHTELQVARDWYLGGAVVELDTVSEYIDLNDTEKWGSKETQMACTYQGKTWGVPWHGSAYSPTPFIFYGAMLVNLETFEQFETDWTFQELDEVDKNWTYDTFLEILPEISDTTDPKNAVFGFQYIPAFATCAVYANGGDKVVWDEAQGKYVYGLTSSSKGVTEAITWAKEVIAMEDCTNCDTSVTPFLNGKSVIAMPNPNRIFGDIYPTTTNVCFIPFPYGPDVEYGTTYTGYLNYNDSACGLYVNNDKNREKATAFLFNELTKQLAIGTNEESYLEWQRHNVFGKDEDGSTLQEYSFNVYKNNGLNIKWSYCLELGSVDTAITNALNKLIIKDASEIIELLNNLENQANNVIDGTINP